MSAIAEREIVCNGASGRLSIDAPVPDGQDWRCEYDLSWLGYHRHSYALGVDSFQALQLAMVKAVVDVAASNDFKAGQINGFGAQLATIDDLKQFFGTPRLPGFDP